jgi:hypothetical protein
MADERSTIALKKNNDVESNATVTVASKFPMDFALKLYDMVERQEPVMGGGFRTFKMAQQRPNTKVFLVQGNSFPQNKGAHQQIAAGYAITHGIPKAFWEQWLEQNKHADYVVNEMIFAFGDQASTIAKAKEMENVPSNLERLDPNKLPKNLKTDDTMRRAS